EDHGAGAGKALGLFVVIVGGDGLTHLVLDQAVRPGDADVIGLRVGSEAEDQGRALINLLLIELAGPHFHTRAGGEFQVLDAGERYLQPAVLNGGGVLQKMNGAVGSEHGNVNDPVVGEVGGGGGGPGGCGAADFAGLVGEGGLVEEQLGAGQDVRTASV